MGFVMTETLGGGGRPFVAYWRSLEAILCVSKRLIQEVRWMKEREKE